MTLLNDAKAIYLNGKVDTVYAGGNQVWPPIPSFFMLTNAQAGNSRPLGGYYVGGFVTPRHNMKVIALGCNVSGAPSLVSVFLVDQTTGVIVVSGNVDPTTAQNSNGFCYITVSATIIGGRAYALAANGNNFSSTSDVNGSDYTFTPDFLTTVQPLGGCYNGGPGGIYARAGTAASTQYVGVDLEYQLA